MGRGLYAVAGLASALLATSCTDCSDPVMRPRLDLDGGAPASAASRFAYEVPLDPGSPWPKFRGDARQSGRSAVRPARSDARPWIFPTGKGVFSSPVIDGDGTAYIGSADHGFYAIRADGSLRWKVLTGEVIDSSALLDDRGRVYVPSGDGHLYALDRATGRELWRFRAHTPQQVARLHGIEVFNLDWWEGSIAMLPDGALLAGNDNYLYYRLDRETGADLAHLVVNELAWSAPAVNVRTGRVFVGSMFVALRNLFAFDPLSGERLWSGGGLGSVVGAPLLTSSSADGAVVVGGFDGYVRAFRQRSGRQLWKFAARDHIYASPAQLSDGRIVIASSDGTLYALEPEGGTAVWAFDTLAPIRSSPAIDGEDHIYVGSGEGKLLAIDPDGQLRWSFQCIDDERNDLNGSPGLGPLGVTIGGEDGSICFVPYDYCLSDVGRADRRCASAGGEGLPDAGARLYFTSRFGALSADPPARIDANEPLAFTLSVRAHGDTQLALIDGKDLRADISSGKPRVDVSADGRFLTIVPGESWAGPAGGTLRIVLRGSYRIAPWRFGLKAFGGKEGGRFEQRFSLAVAPRAPATMPYRVPRQPGDPATAFEIGRLSAPNPTMLPSWNQIGFDSIRYLGGLVEGSGNHALLWMVGGRHDGATGRAVVDPANGARFALALDWDDGLLTLRNDDGFRLDFNGSWAMPYQRYRIATRAAADGRIERAPALNAVIDCDQIARYGRFLKVMGLSAWDTGLMHLYGGADMSVWDAGPQAIPEGVGHVEIAVGEREAMARIDGGGIRKGDHTVGLLLVDAQSGAALPLDYAFATRVEADGSGVVTAVRVAYEPGRVRGAVRAYYMVDTYPAFVATVLPGSR
jgi:outer membrane protein assembly factor BamB